MTKRAAQCPYCSKWITLTVKDGVFRVHGSPNSHCDSSGTPPTKRADAAREQR